MLRSPLPLLCAAAVLGGFVGGRLPAADDKLDPAQVELFEKRVRPLLVATCFWCHSSELAEGGLRLDARAAALTGGDSGPALIRGEPDKSRLVEAIGYRDKDLRMPPKGKLSDEQIGVLTAWVKMGA